jgi:hypothetical protein
MLLVKQILEKNDKGKSKLTQFNFFMRFYKVKYFSSFLSERAERNVC